MIHSNHQATPKRKRRKGHATTVGLIAYLVLLAVTAGIHSPAYEGFAFMGGIALLAVTICTLADIATSRVDRQPS